MRSRFSLIVFAVLCVSLGVTVGSCIEFSSPSVATAESETVIEPTPPVAPNGYFDFSDLAEEVQPAVVNISTTKIVTQNRQNPFFDPEQLPPQFRDLFRFFSPQQPDNGGPQGPEKRKLNNSLGSGVVVAPDGFVVTNNHVIDGADEIRVVFGDGSGYDAEIVGTDDKTDVALLKIEASEPFPYLKFGDSDQLRVGQWVLAVGNPFGLNHTFTSGIVSAKGRRIGSDITYQDFIQTDASINPGNSGGPLLNLQGELVGVNTAIFSRTGQSAGIGFAIPSNLVKFVVDQLQTKQRVDRGYLGVLIQGVDEQIADSLGLDDAKGALVTKVLKDGPAGKAGVRVGDLIIAFNGQEVGSMAELPLLVSTTPPGEKSTLTVIRDGKRVNIALKLGEMPTETSDKTGDDDSDTQEEQPTRDVVLGMTVRTLSSDEREQVGIEQEGLIVTEIDTTSSAFEAGVRRGDVLLRAGTTELSSVADLQDSVETAQRQGKAALLTLIWRNGNNRFVGIGLSD